MPIALLPPSQLLREASEEQDVSGCARAAAHGGEAVPLLHLRRRVRLQQRPRAAHARRPRRRAQGRQARVVQEDGEAAVQVIQGCREVQ